MWEMALTCSAPGTRLGHLRVRLGRIGLSTAVRVTWVCQGVAQPSPVLCGEGQLVSHARSC